MGSKKNGGASFLFFHGVELGSKEVDLSKEHKRQCATSGEGLYEEKGSEKGTARGVEWRMWFLAL